jgi:hypothetical protein
VKSNLIKDRATKDAVRDLEKIAERLKKIPQLPTNATTEQIVKVLNKITDSIKR